MSDTNTTGVATTGQIAPAQMAALLSAAAQALLAAQPTPAAPAGDTGTGATKSTEAANVSDANASPTAGVQAVAGMQQPAAGALATGAETDVKIAPSPVAGQAAAVTTADPEQLTLLKKIDANVTDLSASVAAIQKTAVRNGAIAGGVAGGVSGGIVATGLAFIRAHLGL